MTKETIEDWTNEVHKGDAREVLSDMPSGSVNMAVTSPPYYGLRDYGEEGQLGLENTPGEFIENIVEVCSEIKRVLRDDGSFYLNFGDSFAGAGPGQKLNDVKEIQTSPMDKSSVSFPSKCKMLIPHRIAISLIDDGWICRNDVVWKKPNPMPESVTDRRSTKFEYVFHFVKQKNYYYDLDSIREPYAEVSEKRAEYSFDGTNEYEVGNAEGFSEKTVASNPGGKNPGDIQEVTTANHSEAHFAVFPPELIKPHIKSSCPEDGIVLDPFIGSGTTAVVSEKLGRNWIGIDLNKDYVDMSYDRIDDETKRIFEDGGIFDY